MRFVPCQELGDTPNVVVDGAGQQATLRTLSHWPRSGTPWPLKADLSAQSAFLYLERPEWQVRAEAVSNNHFDEDGLVGVLALTDPARATAERALLEDVAAAGDFGTYRAREAARVAFTLSAFADAETSPLGRAIFERPYPELAAALYRELLPRLPDIVTNLDSYRRFWAEEDAHLSESEAAIRAGAVRIEEVPALDLAVVMVPEERPAARVHRFTQRRAAVCHPMAVHRATRRFRVLFVQGSRCELAYRYETWVQYVSERPLPRVDLAPLAAELTALEPTGVRWRFDGADQITPRLRLVDASGAAGAESALSPGEFRRRLERFLAAAPPAWDPYDPR